MSVCNICGGSGLLLDGQTACVCGDGTLAGECEGLRREARRLDDKCQLAYRERNLLVAFLAQLYPSHMKMHPAEQQWEKDWRNIVCIHTPAGQMTWHIHDSEAALFGFLNRAPDPFAACEWDGHTTEQKYQRLADLAACSAGQ